jgi:hypothetical protein
MNCRYINSSPNYQIVVLIGRGWEKTLQASQGTNFVANPNDLLEIRDAFSPFSIVVDRIPCIELTIT